jgi:CheY-like chemotaxis protein
MAKLLLVDDDRGTLAWMSTALTALGHEVRGYESGIEALDALGSWEPDLVVADIPMPELDGLTFARIVRRFRKVPVLFVSVATKQADAVLAGASGYVQKPATAAEVRAAVQRVLAQGSTRARILIVEDEPDSRELYRLVLEPDFEVLEAENGADALALLLARPIDLVIVDVHMPVMNGVELIRTMRSDPALETVPVIVQSNDRTARESPMWQELHVAQVLDKRDFVLWLDSRIRARLAPGSDPAAPRA